MDFHISQSLRELTLSHTKQRVGRTTPLFALAQYDRPHRNHIAEPPNTVPQPSLSPKRLARAFGSINLRWSWGGGEPPARRRKRVGPPKRSALSANKVKKAMPEDGLAQPLPIA